ncbi:phage portal protein [uncultured Marinobacter sp.]|uniref:phage portal protein n=1 Tax=uncultured Marinobacter sp. TaxID=187379 RepID=UPI0030D711C8
MNKPRLRVRVGETPVYRAQAYEGATHGRRATGWNAPATGPNRALNGSLNTLRNRARQGFRNNAWIERAITRNVVNEVGTGITPIFESSFETFNAAAAELWLPWTGMSAPDGSLDFYGQLAQAVRCRRIAGEVFIRARSRPASFGMTVPVQLQVIEPDHVPETLNEDLRNGNRIIAGKEYNRRGQFVAVWMYPEHPQDAGMMVLNRLLRIPASQIIHHYLPLRPGQVRGGPDVVQSLLRARTYDSYEDSELVRKETRAPFTGFLAKDYTNDQDWNFDPVTGEPVGDDDPLPEVNAQPGTILTGAAGEKMTLFDGDNTGSGYSDFQRQQLLSIAGGAKSLYELVTGDWSKINDRTYRAMITEYRREIETAQDHLTIHQICEKVGFWFTDAAVLSGAIRAPGYADRYDDYNRRDWRTQRWPHINPTQDVAATVKEIENDLESLDAAVAKRGYRAADVQQANVNARKRKAEMLQGAGITEEE